MHKRSVSEDDLRRLKLDREAVDRRYNEALSEVDAAIQRLPEFPHPPPAPDETQVTPLNNTWDLVARRPPLPSGWRGRLAAFVWGLVEPSLAAQQTFNAALVDHVNRNIGPQREIPKSIETAVAVLREQTEQLIRFESRLIVYLQQITPYVDTKDYEFRGLGQRVSEDVAEAQADTARTVRGLAAALGAVSDDMLKRWERYEGLRTSLATLQQAVHALRREVERRGAVEATTAIGAAEAPPRHRAGETEVPPPDHTGVAEPPPGHPAGTHDTRSSGGALAPPSGSGGALAPPSSRGASAPPDVSYTLSSSRLDSHKYLSFEDVFRGDPATIRERQRAYLSLFTGRSDVLDIGCGRGEFLELLQAHGVPARGIDINHAMVAQCLDKGLDVRESDALEYLRGLPADALGGFMAAQVVEHLQPDYLLALLEDAFRALRPGSPIVLETINVASWYAFFSSYIRDITHARPLHPDTLRFFVAATGFLDAEVRLLSPLPDEEKLQPSPRLVRDVDLRTTPIEGRALVALADAFDANADRLNRQLYGPHDYAVVAWKR